MHRYFSDREALVAAAVADSVQAIDQAVADAAHDDGTSREAMRRLVAALVAVGDRLIFLFGDARVLACTGSTPPRRPPGCSTSVELVSP